uniref:SH2 domain-containing protein n=1 Tax=Pelusios castaneus TaxID=367368 RepID=A0A8C8SEA6_9SAUR
MPQAYRVKKPPRAAPLCGVPPPKRVTPGNFFPWCDSAFLVRQSSGQGWKQPFTLAVLYQGHVYNIPIRYLESSRQYTLGKEGKRREELFDSISSIIQHYSQQPLVLIDGSSSARVHTCLLYPVKP